MADPIGTAYVGRTDGKPMQFFTTIYDKLRFDTQTEAEEFLCLVMHVADPNGLDNGDYYVDVVTEES